MIERRGFDWGIELTTTPFAEDARLGSLQIRAEVHVPHPNRGPTVKITFSGAITSRPLDLVAAQTWASAMNAMVLESQSILAEMRSAHKQAKFERVVREARQAASSRRKRT
jgi:hypothetical protein